MKKNTFKKHRAATLGFPGVGEVRVKELQDLIEGEDETNLENLCTTILNGYSRPQFKLPLKEHNEDQSVVSMQVWKAARRDVRDLDDSVQMWGEAAASDPDPVYHRKEG